MERLSWNKRRLIRERAIDLQVQAKICCAERGFTMANGAKHRSVMDWEKANKMKWDDYLERNL